MLSSVLQVFSYPSYSLHTLGAGMEYLLSLTRIQCRLHTAVRRVRQECRHPGRSLRGKAGQLHGHLRPWIPKYFLWQRTILDDR